MQKKSCFYVVVLLVISLLYCGYSAAFKTSLLLSLPTTCNALPYQNKQKQSAEKKMLKELIEPGDIIFDVGCNRGAYIKTILDLNRGPITIYGFEPAPEVFSLLCYNLANAKFLRLEDWHNLQSQEREKYAQPAAMFSHGTYQINLFNCAVGAKNGKIPFFYFDKNGLATELSGTYLRPLVVSQVGAYKKFIVPCCTIDSFCAEHNIRHIDLLKIDTEGAEFDVIKGATTMLQHKAIDAIQFEYGGAYQDAQITLENVYTHLQNFGYAIFKLCDNEFLPMYTFKKEHEDFCYVNFLAVLCK